METSEDAITSQFYSIYKFIHNHDAGTSSWELDVATLEEIVQYYERDGTFLNVEMYLELIMDM